GLALVREPAAGAAADGGSGLGVVLSLVVVGRLLRDTGDMAGAVVAYEEVRDLAAGLAAESPTDAVQAVLALGYQGIGTVLWETGKRAETLQAIERVRDLRQKLAVANPAVADFQI